MAWSRRRRAGPSGPDNQSGGSVTVVIPCYNYGRYLQGCINSVLSQKGVETNIILIDDASTDDSADTARAIARQEPRVELIVHGENRGHIATYNEGLAQATGDFSVLLSADDLLVPGSLARATAVFAAHPNVGLVYGRAVYFTKGDELPVPSFKSGHHVVWGGIEWAETRCRTGRVGIVSPEVVVRTKLQQEIGGYRTDLPHSGDSEMWLRFATRADIGYVDGDHAFYRVHAASMSKSQFNTALADARQRHRAFESAFTNGQNLPSDGTRLLQLANRGIAGEVLWGVCRAYDRGEADPAIVEDLIGFATEIFPGAIRLPEYRRLQVRRRAGARQAVRMAPLWFPDLAVHRVRLLRQYFGDNWWWHLKS